MDVRLGKDLKKGYVLFDKNIYNEFILKQSFLDNNLEVKDESLYVMTKNLLQEKGFLFSKYEGIKYKFIDNRNAGIYYVNFMRYYKLAAWADIDKEAYVVEGATIETNPQYDQRWSKCWAYDINSAYPAALLKPIPDVNNDLGLGFIKEGQIGYNENEEGVLIEVYEGFATYRFNLIPSPWKDYVRKQYNKIKNFKAKGNFVEAGKVKESLVIAIGVLRNHNPFLYTHILTECRNQINKYKDENTMLINTDCIYSAVPRDDIPLGKEIGEFKTLAQNGSLIYIDGADYQWENGEKCLRGIPKELQATYDLETKTQIKKPKYELRGLEICTVNSNVPKTQLD